MPDVVAMSGIVPATISLPLPFNTGSNIPFGVVRTIFAFEGLRNAQLLKRLRKGISRCYVIEDERVCAEQGLPELFRS